MRYLLKIILICLALFLFAQNEPYFDLTHFELFTSYSTAKNNTFYADLDKDGKYSFVYATEANYKSYIISLDSKEGKIEQKLHEKAVFEEIKWMEYDSIDNVIYVSEKNKLWKYDPISETLEIFRELPTAKISKFDIYKTETEFYCIVEGFGDHFLLDKDGIVLFDKWLGSINEFEIGNVDEDDDLELVILEDSKLRIHDLLTFEEEWVLQTGYAYDCTLLDFNQNGISTIYIRRSDGFHCIDAVLQKKVWFKEMSSYTKSLIYAEEDNDQPILIASTKDSIYALNPEAGDIKWQTTAFDGTVFYGMQYGDFDGDSSSELFYCASKKIVVFDFDEDSTWVSNFKSEGAYIELIDDANQSTMDYIVCSGFSDFYKPGLLEKRSGYNDSILGASITLNNKAAVNYLSSILYEEERYYVVKESNGDFLVYKNDFSSIYSKYSPAKDSVINVIDIFQHNETGEPFIIGIQNKSKIVIYSFIDGTFKEVWNTDETSDYCLSYQIGDFDSDSNKEIAILYNTFIRIYDLTTYEMKKQVDIEEVWTSKGFDVGDFDNDGSLDFIVGVQYGNDSNTEIQVIDIQSEEKKKVKISDGMISVRYLELINIDDKGKSELLINGDHLFIYDIEKESIVFDGSSNGVYGHRIRDVKIADLDNDKHMDVLLAHNFGYWRLRARDAYEDVEMPFVVNYSPSEEQKKVSTDKTITILFSEEMDLSSLNEIEVLNGDDVAEEFQISLSSDLTSIAINPTQNWTANSLIKVRLPNSIKDLAGLNLDGNKNGVNNDNDDDFIFSIHTGSGIDNTNPVIISIEADDEVLLYHTLSVQGEITDTSATVHSKINEIKYSIDNSNVIAEGINVNCLDGAFDESTESFQIDIKQVNTGIHTLYIAGKDEIGNWSQVEEVTFTVIDKSSFDWSYIGYDLYNTSNAYYSQAELPLSLRYSFEGGPQEQKRTIIVADKLIGTDKSKIWMRDLNTGELVWERKFDYGYELGVPCFYNGDIYFILGSNYYHDLFCLNFDDGSIKWNNDLIYSTCDIYPMIVSAETIFMLEGCNSIYMRAYSANTGELMWSTQLNNQYEYTQNPAIYDDKVYCYSSNFKVLDMKTGEELKSIGEDILPSKLGEERSFFSPVIDVLNNQVLLLNSGYIYALDLDSYELKWTFDTEEYGFFNTLPALSKNSLYIGNSENVIEIDASNGELKWKNEELKSEFTPAVTDKILVFSSDSSTVVLDRPSKNVKGKIDQGGAISLSNELLVLSDSLYFNVYMDSETLSGTIVQTGFIPCYGDSTGAIQVEVNNGIGELVYQWDDIEDNTDVRENLKAGEYFVSVSDELFNYGKLSIDLQQPDELILSTNSEDASNDQADGSAEVIPSGGTKPYQYIWSDFPEVADSLLSNIKAGEYEVEVIDANGCSTITTIVVNTSTNTNNIHFEKEIMIIPTISTGDFQVKVESKWVGSNYSIYNRGGKEVDSGFIASTLNQIETELPSGIYYFSMVKGNRKTDTKFVVVR